MKEKIISLLFVILITITGCERFHRLPPEKRFDKLVEYLNDELSLTPEQYQQLKKVKEKMIERHKLIKPPPFWFDENFLKDLENGKIDKEEIKKSIKEMHNKILENRLQDIDDIYPLVQTLSSEQRKKLVDLIQKHKKNFQRHH